MNVLDRLQRDHAKLSDSTLASKRDGKVAEKNAIPAGPKRDLAEAAIAGSMQTARMLAKLRLSEIVTNMYADGVPLLSPLGTGFLSDPRTAAAGGLAAFAGVTIAELWAEIVADYDGFDAITQAEAVDRHAAVDAEIAVLEAEIERRHLLRAQDDAKRLLEEELTTRTADIESRIV